MPCQPRHAHAKGKEEIGGGINRTQLRGAVGRQMLSMMESGAAGLNGRKFAVRQGAYEGSLWFYVI